MKSVSQACQLNLYLFLNRNTKNPIKKSSIGCALLCNYDEQKAVLLNRLGFRRLKRNMKAAKNQFQFEQVQSFQVKLNNTPG